VNNGTQGGVGADIRANLREAVDCFGGWGAINLEIKFEQNAAVFKGILNMGAE